MNNPIRAATYLLTWLMLVSCTRVAPTTPSPPPPSSTPVITKTGRPTPTPTPTRTPPPSLTPAPTADVHLVRRCFREENQEVALKDVTSGTILQGDALLDIQTGRRYRLPSGPLQPAQFPTHFEDRYRFLVSPDGKQLVYLKATNNQQELWVVDARAKVLAKIPFERKDLNFPRWLNNEQVILYTDQTYQDGSMWVVNPFTREQTTVSNELPVFTLMRGTAMNWLVEYSPDLRWVVYVDNDLMVTVRNVISQETLWQSLLADYESLPAWSPDSQQVAIVGIIMPWSPDDQQDAIEVPTQLYLIDRSGQVKSILPEEVRKPSGFFTPVWSPDGRQIAFWKADNRCSPCLLVYDTQSGEVIDTCIPNNSYTYHNPVRWSPDSQQLVTYTRLDSGEIYQNSMRLVDLQKGVVYTNLKEQNLEPNTWMSSIP